VKELRNICKSTKMSTVNSIVVLLSHLKCDEHAFCTICLADISIAHSRLNDIKQHVGTIKHVILLKSRGEAKSITLFHGNDLQVTRAEMLLASAVVEHNLPVAFEFYYFACNLVFKIAVFMQF